MNNKEIKKLLNDKISQLLTEHGMELVELNISGKDSPAIVIYIYKPEGVTLDDCTNISRLIDKEIGLDDIFEDKYTLEVSSPGIDRKLKTLDDYRRNLGKTLEVKLYKAKEGNKTFIGKLDSYDDNQVFIKTDDDVISFNRDEISVLREYIDFGGKK